MYTFRCRILFSFALLLLMKVCGNAQDLLKYVQPMAGTAPANTPAALKHSEAGSTEKNANTIPAVGLPFGMTQWVPQTRTSETKCIPPYVYNDSLLSGFRGTHWISGSCMQDYGSFTIMPVAGKLATTANDYAIPFSHAQENSSAAGYSLRTNKVQVELTATLRCGIMKFTMLEDDSLYLLIIPNSDYGKGMVAVNIEDSSIQAYNTVHRIYQGWGQPAGFKGWMHAKLSAPPAIAGTFRGGQVLPANTLSDQKEIGAYVGWKLQKGETIILRIGTSFTGVEGASKNLAVELENRSFGVVMEYATATWNKALGVVKAQTSDERVKRIFYTSLYHSMQQPRLYNDADGRYPAFGGSGELKFVSNGNYYDDFSMWDIYRAELPLLSIIDTSLTNDFVRSMILKGQQGRWLPIFPCWNSYTSAMIGDHVTAFIAAAYNRGIRNYDVQQAYDLMRQNSFTVANDKDYLDGIGRRALPSYLQYGYIPMEDSVPVAFHKREQVSRTLEYAFDDYALSTIAKSLHFSSDYEKLKQRSQNYRNVFDPSVNMMNGRHVNGAWASNFLPDFRASYITEGTPRQYTFYVPHDVHGLASLMGGERALEKALDNLFAKGEYWHGNEPGHQIPFMYNFTPSPWKGQKVVQEILREEYSDGPGGLSGNDDAGQMSAWYVFAAMGFYPLNPVSGEYMLTSPQFDSCTISVAGGKSFRIIAHRTSAGDAYISKVQWNGRQYHQNYITHSMLQQGGKLDIWLSDQPTVWGAKLENRVIEIK